MSALAGFRELRRTLARQTGKQPTEARIGADFLDELAKELFKPEAARHLMGWAAPPLLEDWMRFVREQTRAGEMHLCGIRLVLA